jgi:hypothetical protein
LHLIARSCSHSAVKPLKRLVNPTVTFNAAYWLILKDKMFQGLADAIKNTFIITEGGES